MFLLSLQSNQEKVWKFPKFSTDTYWLEGELHYIKYLKEAFILRPIKLFYQCLLSVIKNFLNFKKKIKSSLKYFWKKCDLFTTLFSQKNLIRIQSLRYIFLVLSIPIWVQWWLKFSTPLWKNLLLFLMSWVTLVYPQCDPSFFGYNLQGKTRKIRPTSCIFDHDFWERRLKLNLKNFISQGNWRSQRSRSVENLC